MRDRLLWWRHMQLLKWHVWRYNTTRDYELEFAHRKWTNYHYRQLRQMANRGVGQLPVVQWDLKGREY